MSRVGREFFPDFSPAESILSGCRIELRNGICYTVAAKNSERMISVLIVLNILIFLVFLFIWVYPPYRRQGKEGMPAKKWYLFNFLITAIPGFVVAVILQLLLQAVTDRMTAPTVVIILIDAFLSAGVFEEVIKFFGGRLLLKRSQAVRKIDYIFLFAASGIGFELTESIFSVLDGNLIGSVIRGVFCLHVFWQIYMGAHYYEYRKAKETGNQRAACGQFFRFLIVPILLHGLNDFGVLWILEVSSTDLALQDDMQIAAALLAIGIALVVGIIFIIRTEIMVYREANRSRMQPEMSESVGA